MTVLASIITGISLSIFVMVGSSAAGTQAVLDACVQKCSDAWNVCLQECPPTENACMRTCDAERETCAEPCVSEAEKGLERLEGPATGDAPAK